MSPERRVSWPTTIAPPGPASRWATARPRPYATVGLRSTLATPRIPSVPKSLAIGQRRPLGEAAGLAAALAFADGLGLGEAIGTPVMMTVTFGGLAATSVVPAGRFAVTGTSTVPAPRSVTLSSATRAAPCRR